MSASVYIHSKGLVDNYFVARCFHACRVSYWWGESKFVGYQCSVCGCARACSTHVLARVQAVICGSGGISPPQGNFL